MKRCILACMCLLVWTAVAAAAGDPAYSRPENWAWFGVGEDKPADLFIVCPTVDMRDETNMSLDDEAPKAAFAGALAMKRGIYEDTARLYAPFYRQATMKACALPENEREEAIAFAYRDVSAAFANHLATENGGCHGDDDLFFFRNLQANVRLRTANHLAGTGLPQVSKLP